MFDFKVHRKNLVEDQMAEGLFDPMVEVLKPGQQGVAKIDHFTMSPAAMISSIAEHYEDFVPTGRFARLKVNGQLMMSDTPMEKRTNLEIIQKANGRVLIAGLGLGMILRTLVRKPEVTHITVLEKYQDVIDLVAPSFDDLAASAHVPGASASIRQIGECRLEVLCKDVFEWEPSPDWKKYNVIYFDIWPNSNVSNLPEMDRLYKRYRSLLAKGGWMDSWTYKKLKEKQKADIKFDRELPVVLEKHWREQGEFKSKLALMRMLAAYADDPHIFTDNNIRTIREFAAAKGIKL